MKFNYEEIKKKVRPNFAAKARVERANTQHQNFLKNKQEAFEKSGINCIVEYPKKREKIINDIYNHLKK